MAYAACSNTCIMKKTILLLWLLWPALIFSQTKPAYQLFDQTGQAVDYGKLLELSAQTKLVLFGELHNNPISHWLQLELTRDLYGKVGNDLVLGAEMFETDNQMLLVEYLTGLIAERNFRAEAKLWRNYETDYRPLVEFAREHGLPFIGTNIPRRYAALVHREGFEALENLPAEAQRLIAPLPVAYDPELPGYKAMLEMTGLPAHGSENLPKAQAIKDATMAHFIYQNLNRNGIFIHFHGTYHSNNFEGIVWYLREMDEKLPLITIATVEQEQVDALDEEHLGLADIILVVPATMTKTY
jgi:uncharacterized iron-regulated protein